LPHLDLTEMQPMRLVFLLAYVNVAAATDENPLGKVIQLMDELSAKVVADGEAEAKAYKEYVAWCDNAAANTRNDIKTNSANKAKLEANIGEFTANIEAGTTKIEELAGAISQASSELKDATAVRDKEAAEFAVSEKELVDTVDTLDRAISILQRQMANNPAALAQIDNTNMKTLVDSLGVVIDAAGLNGNDKKKPPDACATNVGFGRC
jgi:chromosome segregation ATPase